MNHFAVNGTSGNVPLSSILQLVNLYQRSYINIFLILLMEVCLNFHYRPNIIINKDEKTLLALCSLAYFLATKLKKKREQFVDYCVIPCVLMQAPVSDFL